MKLPEIWPGAAEDRLADHRRRNHFVVEHDGERLADILLRRFGEFARARGIEAEIDDRLAGALVEARLRVDQIAAGNQHALFDQIFLARLSPSRISESAGGCVCIACSGVIGLIDHAEIELGGLAEKSPSAA